MNMHTLTDLLSQLTYFMNPQAGPCPGGPAGQGGPGGPGGVPGGPSRRGPGWNHPSGGTIVVDDPTGVNRRPFINPATGNMYPTYRPYSGYLANALDHARASHPNGG